MLLRRDYNNIGILAMCEALFMTTVLINITVAGLAAQLMLTNLSYATLPQAMIPLVSMLVTIPASLAMKVIGRRAGFMIGAFAGMASGVFCAFALYFSSFSLFMLGVALMGVYQAFATYYRFAVADQADDANRGKAVSLVLAGGVLAAFLGPAIASVTGEMFSPVLFMGSYVAIVALNFAAVVLLGFLRLPQPQGGETRRLRIDLRPVLTDVRVIIAMLFCGFGTATMMLVMTATPLAMAGCGFGLSASGAVISWHVAAMFVPFFFSGSLIARFGLYRVMYAGLLLMGASGLIAASGESGLHFGLALAVSGLAWNFMYVGGSTLLASIRDEENRPMIQGANEFFSFAITTISVFASGAIYSSFGWVTLNLAAVVVSLLLLLLFIARRQRVIQVS